MTSCACAGLVVGDRLETDANMKRTALTAMLLLIATAVAQARADSPGPVNQGLVAVGRVPADAFDALGSGVDTLGGFGSAAFFDPATWAKTGETITGTLYGLPDRGFGDGAQNYRPRIEIFDIGITPYYGSGPVPQDRITLNNTGLLLFTYDGTNNFTGFDGNDAAVITHPQSATNSLGGGRRSLDAEGLVRLDDGSWYVSDEYGSFIYKFSSDGALEGTFALPESLMPRKGTAYPRTNSFTGASAPDSGRRNNRGLEGLSLTPDGKRLMAMLQSPTIQDGGSGSGGRNTRLIVFDADTLSATYGTPLAEYVYELTLRGSAATNRHTPVSEILALNRTEFLVLERDQIGQGLSGADTNTAPTYKQVVLASLDGASNIINTAYDLERGAPGQRSLPSSGLPADVRPIARQDFVNLLDPVQLAKFGLNAGAPHNTNTVSEKWESLSLIPAGDPAMPDDFLLLVINDNDFKAPVVYHNGIPVGTNDVPMDSILLAYRVTLPTYGSAPPANQTPQVAIANPTNAFLAAPIAFKLTARAYDQDGRILKVEFWDGANKLGEDTTFPFELPVTLNPGETFSARAVAYDNEGAAATSTVFSVTGTADNLAPQIALTSPADGSNYAAPAQFTLTAAANDVDGWIARVVFHRNGVPLATNSAAPYQLSLANHPLGTFSFSAVATDNQGATATSPPITVVVTKNSNSTPLALQILHASDLEAGVSAVEDAPAFSSVLAALQAEYPTNTLILSSGDNYIPGPFFNAAADPAAGFGGVGGRADIAMLNAMGFQVSAFGNHEFDAGTAQTRSILLRDATVNYAGALFPYLSANLDFNADSNMKSLVGADGQVATVMTNRVARSCVVSVAGQLVGIVGATTRDLRSISSPGGVGVDGDIAAAVQSAVDALLPLGVNKVIVLAHLQQFTHEFDLAQQLHDVDVVIAGGSHAIFAKPTDRLRVGDTAAADYPVWFRTTLDEPVAVVNCGANYRYVGRLVVQFGANGLIAACDAAASGAYATDAQGVTDTGGLPPNPAVLNIATNVGAILNAKDGSTFGRTTVYLNGLRQFVRTEESNLGDLSADANLWWGQRTDPTASISLKNGGGIRDSIGAVLGYGGGATYVPPLPNPGVGKEFGEISQLDIENALRFNNGLSLVTLTAQQLRDTMEWSVAAVAPNATPGQFPQVGGIWFSYNPTNPPMTYAKSGTTITGIATPGSRLRSLIAARADGTLDLVVENGVLVGDPNRTFRMVTLDFLAAGGDSYFPLTLASSRQDLAVTNTTFKADGREQWAFASYLAHIPAYAEADTPATEDQRIQNLAVRADTVAWPRIVSIAADTASTTLRIAGVAGFAYLVQAAPEPTGEWVNLGWATANAGGLFQFVDTDRALYPRRFYRVVRMQVPGAKLAVFSDPHYMHPSLLIEDGLAFQTYLAQDRKLLKESVAIFNAVVDGIAQAQPEIVLVPGDLTKDGELVSHQGVTNALQRLRNAGAKVFVCPGNHDVNNPHALAFAGANVSPVPSVSPAEFAQLYAAYGYGDAVARDPGSLSYVAEPTPGLWILAMDSCRYERNTNGTPFTGGYFDAARWAWITNQLASARTQGKFVLGMMHHGVAEHYAGQKLLFPDYVLDDYQAVAAAFASYGMRVVFTGHYHAQDVIKSTYDQGTLHDIETGSTVTYPCPFRMMTLGPNGVLAIQSYQVTAIDYDLGGLDFPTYASRFLTDGLMGLSKYLLMQPPYNLPQPTAELLAPAMTEAFASHYRGDESSRPISPQTQGIIAYLQSQTGDPMAQLMANALLALFNDPVPADNTLAIDLLQ
jgi:2',3'-cyclic-nucleotide 2'-phosphodiesterase (5'-nucleotidase family)/3',5'-cyclic AMP phosphodiesterase CpdA